MASSSYTLSPKQGLISPDKASAAAATGAAVLNGAVKTIQSVHQEDAPVSFQMLGLMGGLAMVVSNGLNILERFFSFNLSGSLMATYGVLFGSLITLLNFPDSTIGPRFKGSIYHYAQFLEFLWGRGALYFFVGSLQWSNFNLIDWAVGGFMMFLGVAAIGATIGSTRDLELLKQSVQNEEMLKQMWQKHDKDRNGCLDIRELTSFVKDAKIKMTRNEIVAFMVALDKNFDDEISYEEFYSWWNPASSVALTRGVSV